MAHIGVEQFVNDFDNVPVRRRHDYARLLGNYALGIAEEVENEQGQNNQNSPGPFPMHANAKGSRRERGNRKFIGILDHERW